jgi:hypothetical protein
MIGFIDTLYTHNSGLYAITALSLIYTLYSSPLHALGFSVFASRILATDLEESHCNFKSHMEPSFHSLIPFLQFLLTRLRMPFPELDPFLDDNFLLQLNSQLLATNCSLELLVV